LPKLGSNRPSLPKLGQGGPAPKAIDTGGGSTGLVGDFMIPAIGYAYSALPGPAKAAAAGVGAAYGVYKANEAAAPYRGMKAPEKPEKR
jgi:hypothetical protein